MDHYVDVAGRARVVLLDAPSSLAHAVARRLDPYPLVPTTRATIEAGAPDVILEAAPASEPCRTFIEMLGDTGDGLATAWDGVALHLLVGGISCELPRLAEAGPLRLRYRPGFPVWSILGPVLGPLLHGVIRERGGVVIHGSAVEMDGEAVVLAGWSESGKTETALALAVGGSPLLSDKWTVLAAADEGLAPHAGATLAGSCPVDALPFPSPLSVRRWVVEALPEIRPALPVSARLQFAGAAVASSLTRAIGISGRTGRGPVDGLFLSALDRTLALGERTSLSMARLRGLGLAAGSPTRERRLRALVVLKALPREGDVTATARRPADRRWAARRLARSAEAERRTWADLLGRMAYTGESMAPAARSNLLSTDPGRAELWQPTAVRIAEEERLARLLVGIPIIEVAAPFPGDPRRTAEAVRRALAEAGEGPPAVVTPLDPRQPRDEPEGPAAIRHVGEVA